jgi:carbamoyl-phosphate synthase large subunit
MPLKPGLKKVLVIGSGPIVIGQAAEFDYAGTQACRSLREEGLEVVLLNSNPATIMTDPHLADRVYLEPILPEVAEEVIKKERPQGLLPTLGGQVGLNLAVELHRAGVLDRYGVELLGTSLETIERAEDRELFRRLMLEIGEPVPESEVVRSLEEAFRFARKVGFPLVVRPAYTLGGTGGGMVRTERELEQVVSRGLALSPVRQVLLERSVEGWKEVEYEVMRDGHDNCITVCNMENFDPMGIHTGDSIVVAPSQTLTDREYHLLRSAALKIIRALGVEGGCNIQFALDRESERYYVIEVNPRVSRSSALASKATGYPIAKIASKIAAGLNLDEIRNPVTGSTSALFEPALDYVVVKIPRWPFDKFATARRALGTQMKATGEVMAIGRTFEEALLKAVRSLDIGVHGLWLPEFARAEDEEILRAIGEGDDRRLFLLAEALRRGADPEELFRRTGVTRFFLDKIKGIVELEAEIRDRGLSPQLLREAKRRGISDAQIATLSGLEEEEVRLRREAEGIVPVYKMVDTCAAEFEAATPYFYSTYEREDESRPGRRPRVVVLGSGSIRIGQGIEFDYSSVHAVWALREMGYEAVIVNQNPETVSTDFDVSDRLYFEPLVFEDVMNVIERERPIGVLPQFGGQTAINLVGPLHRAGVAILGTSPEGIDRAEDREKFDRLLEELGIPRPPGGTATSLPEALTIAKRIGYPVLVRPSYVLGGRAMEIVWREEELEEYMRRAVRVSARRPVLIDKYLSGLEVEVDAVSDGETVVVPAIMEHVERAGIHSGDSVAVIPPRRLSRAEEEVILDCTVRLSRALGVRGLINIQFVVHGGRVYVLEANPRASRTIPYLAKATGVPLVRLADQGLPQGCRTGLLPPPPLVAVKMPVFSFGKLEGVDPALGPEMKSTGEVMGVGRSFAEAMYKALLGAGFRLPSSRPGGTMWVGERPPACLLSFADRDKAEGILLARELSSLTFELFATPGTAAFLRERGLSAHEVAKRGSGEPDVLDLLRERRVDLVVNTISQGREAERDGFLIRRQAVEFGIPCLTSLDTAYALAEALGALTGEGFREVRAVQDYSPLQV